MRDKVFNLGRKIIFHELISGSSLIFLGTTIANFLAFLFNLFLVRNLSYGQYGEFAVAMSLITLITIPSQSTQQVIVRYVTSFFAKKDTDALATFFSTSFRIFLFGGISIAVIFLLLSGPIGNFLHISDTSVMLGIALVIASMYVSIVNASFMQGLLLFSFLSLTAILGGVAKVALGMGFVFLKWGVAGAIFAVFLSFFIPYIFMFIPLRHIVFHKQKKIKLPAKEILSYAIPTIVTILSLSAFTSVDLLLVKHFFSTTQAGFYAGLSLTGRIIFYFTAPITSVMFPLVVKRYEQKENFHSLLYMALLLVLLPSMALTVFYFLFPHLVIQLVLGGKGYQQVSSYLGYFGLFLSLFSAVNVLVNFFLSLKRTEVVILISLGALLQALLILIFHKSFTQVITASTIDMLVLLILLLLYYIKTYGIQKKHFI